MFAFVFENSSTHIFRCPWYGHTLIDTPRHSTKTFKRDVVSLAHCR